MSMPQDQPPLGAYTSPPGYQQDAYNPQSIPMQPIQQQPLSYPPAYGMQPAQQVGYAQQQQPYGQQMQPYGQPPGQPYGQPPMGMQQGPPIQWMALPPSIPNCPPGLEYLTTLDQILVKQQLEIMEVLTGYETKNKYRIFNNMGQNVYFAVEDSETCARNCLGNLRLFDMKILDNLGNEVIHIYRPFRCNSCCYPMCLQELEITAPVGEVVGYVTQLWSLDKQYFQIENSSREPIFKIVGPFCTFTCGGDVVFRVMSNDEQHEVGSIRKQWSGFVMEAYTDADNFGITFPKDLDVRMKAVMLGACFLIDFMFYETQQQRRRHH